jgi:GntR family transcriptional regulator
MAVGNGQAPLYRQARQALVDRIAAGDWAPGDKLPSEPALAAELGMHRLTVRRAVEELSREGVLYARQGAGTFVSRRPAPVAVTIPLSREEFYENLRAQLEAHGQRFRDVLLSTELADDPAVRHDLRYPQGPLRRIDSALDVDGELWAVSTAWAPDNRLPDVGSRWRETDGVYGLLLDDTGGPLQYVWRWFGAEPATIEDAELLGIRPGTPMLLREGLTADERGDPVLRVRRRARGDRLRYVLDYGQASESFSGSTPLTRF